LSRIIFGPPYDEIASHSFVNESVKLPGIDRNRSRFSVWISLFHDDLKCFACRGQLTKIANFIPTKRYPSRVEEWIGFAKFPRVNAPYW